MLQQYFKSFRVDERFWKTFLVDFGIIVIITLLWLGFGHVLNSLAYNISEGKDVAQLKLELLSGDVHKNEQFLASLKWFTAVFVAGSIGLGIGSLFLFSMGQSYIWCILQQQRYSFKKYWRWNGLILMVTLLFTLYFLIYALVRTGITYFIPFSNDTVYAITMSALLAIFMIAFFMFLQIIFFFFQEKYKVWESIGHGLQLITLRWSVLWKYYILIMMTGVVVSIVQYFLQKQLPFQSQWIVIGVPLALLFLYLAWARLLLLKTLSKQMNS